VPARKQSCGRSRQPGPHTIGDKLRFQLHPQPPPAKLRPPLDASLLK
jgi:hypothetical protein